MNNKTQEFKKLVKKLCIEVINEIKEDIYKQGCDDQKKKIREVLQNLLVDDIPITGDRININERNCGGNRIILQAIGEIDEIN